MMNTKTRLERLEQHAQPQAQAYSIWLDDDDGWMLGPLGERITVAEFEQCYPDAVDLSGRPLLVVQVHHVLPRGEE